MSDFFKNPEVLANLNKLAWAVATLIASVVTNHFLQVKLKARSDNKQSRKDRLDPALNVIRETGPETNSVIGRISRVTWYVNPFWIDRDSDEPAIFGFDDMLLRQNSQVIGNDLNALEKRISLEPAIVDQARNKKQWIEFSEWGTELTYRRLSYAGSEHQHLFAPRPVSLLKRIGFGRGRNASKAG